MSDFYDGPKDAQIYFILGPDGHGAETFARRLAPHPDILSLGRTNPLREGEAPCSCGESVADCPFWTKMREVVAYGEFDPFERMLPPTPILAVNDHVNDWLVAAMALFAKETGPKRWNLVQKQAEGFFDAQDCFLAACLERVPHKVFLDAERSALKFMAMATMEFPVAGVFHMVRDPRAWIARQRMDAPDLSIETLATRWAAAHRRLKKLAGLFKNIPFQTVRYEDVMARPDDTVRSALEFMKLPLEEAVGITLDDRKNHFIGMAQVEGIDGIAPHAEPPPSLTRAEAIRAIRAVGPIFHEFGYKA